MQVLERIILAQVFIDALCVVAGADVRLALAKVESILRYIDKSNESTIKNLDEQKHAQRYMESI